MLTEDERRTLAQTPLFSSLAADAAVGLLATAHRLEYARGEHIFELGDRAHSLFVVLDGWVKLNRDSRNGVPVVIAVFTRGESLAEAAALLSERYPASAEAVSDTVLLAIRGRDYLAAMQRSPETLAAGLAAMFRHLHSLVQDIEGLKGRTTRERVAAFLMRLAGRTQGSATVSLPYDKTLIAAKLGTTPENLSRVFGGLREAGVTTFRDKAVIADLGMLAAIARGPGD